MTRRQSNSHPPVETLRDGALKATIWENSGANGPHYSVSFARTYTNEDGRLADSTGFVGADILRIAELARQAYARIGVLRRDYAASPDEPELFGDEDEDEPSPAGRAFERNRGRNGAGSPSPR